MVSEFGTDTVKKGILVYLIQDAQKKLHMKKRLLVSHDIALVEVDQTLELFASLQKNIETHPLHTIIDWHKAFVACHKLYSVLGGVLTADHWQSPAFANIEVDEVGDEQHIIRANVNDYKRDQHPLGEVYERAYARAYLTRSFMAVPTVFATNSGMAALTVAALVIRQRLPKEYVIAVGEHSYFQNHELLHMMFREEYIAVFDESNPETLKNIRPHAIFFDLIANDPSVTVADTSKISEIASRIGHHVDIAIDVTCASMVYLPIPLALLRSGKISLIAYESLNKHHQYGLDRLTGGIMWAYGILNEMLYRARDHAGVILTENAAATLPTPYNTLHIEYLKRHEQNALYLATELSKLPDIRVTYPGLTAHPSHSIAKRIGYFGSFISIELPGKSWREYRRVMQSIITEAQDKHIPMVAGSTFGTPVTRVYTWSTQSKFSRQFLRLSPGLESPDEIKQVCDIISTVLHSAV